jgi:hypothetical protein
VRVVFPLIVTVPSEASPKTPCGNGSAITIPPPLAREKVDDEAIVVEVLILQPAAICVTAVLREAITFPVVGEIVSEPSVFETLLTALVRQVPFQSRHPLVIFIPFEKVEVAVEEVAWKLGAENNWEYTCPAKVEVAELVAVRVPTVIFPTERELVVVPACSLSALSALKLLLMVVREEESVSVPKICVMVEPRTGVELFPAKSSALKGT